MPACAHAAPASANPVAICFHMLRFCATLLLMSSNKGLYSDEAYEDGTFYRARHHCGELRSFLVSRSAQAVWNEGIDSRRNGCRDRIRHELPGYAGRWFVRHHQFIVQAAASGAR